jgi:low temperature requirement protein LtrA
VASLRRSLTFTNSSEGDPVTTLELFFDLVYVFAFTQVTTLMAHGEAPGSLVDGFIVLSLLWWSWCSYAWLANQAHADEGVLKLAFILAMTAIFIACLALPDAFHDTHSALIVVAAYVVVRLTHAGTYLIAARGDPTLRRQVLVTVFAALAPTVALLVAGAFTAQRVLWLIAVIYDFAAVFITANRAQGWVIQSAAHFSERHGLIVILALGESIVATAAGLQDPHLTWRVAAGAVLSLLVAVGLYFAYFDRLSEQLETALDEQEGRPRAALGTDVFTYLHFPIIAGIVLAALGVEHAMGELEEDRLGALGAWALAGGVALFLAATVATRVRSGGEWARPRIVAIVVLLAAAALLALVPPLVAVGVVAAIVLTLAIFEAKE